MTPLSDHEQQQFAVLLDEREQRIRHQTESNGYLARRVAWLEAGFDRVMDECDDPVAHLIATDTLRRGPKA